MSANNPQNALHFNRENRNIIMARKAESADASSIKSKILITLANHPEGLTILELSSILKSHRHTVVKYLMELKGARQIIQRPVGSAILHYLATEQTMRAMGLDGIDSDEDSNRSIADISKRRKIHA